MRLADQIVSVRMPSSLVRELKTVAEKNHFLDVSESIRSLLRDKFLEFEHPLRMKEEQVKRSLGAIASPEKIEALKKTLEILEEINEL